MHRPDHKYMPGSKQNEIKNREAKNDGCLVSILWVINKER